MENVTEHNQSFTNQHGEGFLSGQEPRVTVGIVCGERISFSLNVPYLADGQEVVGDQEVAFAAGAILWNGKRYNDLFFRAKRADASFALKDVTIGINFHWERKETQVFSGNLRFVVEDGKVRAINELPVEDYLLSVISSEMNGTSSLELLKAHAVISRSWLLAQMEKRRTTTEHNLGVSFVQTDEELIRWYDREDHTLFDVCADDHCQRYQGITKATSPQVAEAIRQTRGELLMSDGEICDARFSKCCGGVVEEFQYCWEDTPKPYLKALLDRSGEPDLYELSDSRDQSDRSDRSDRSDNFPDLTLEPNADRWIRTAPPSYCNTHDGRILAQVLNNFDQETTDFYRWRVIYTQSQLSNLIARKLGTDFGKIVNLVPIARGKSGRLYKLKIVGTQKILVVGKELEIRRVLSESHLYSSAFVVDRKDIGPDGIPAAFELIGAGWGHGVGLCQIGAAVMGERGFRYDEILTHYYPGANIVSVYK